VAKCTSDTGPNDWAKGLRCIYDFKGLSWYMVILSEEEMGACSSTVRLGVLRVGGWRKGFFLYYLSVLIVYLIGDIKD